MVQFIENFTSIRWQRLSAESIASQMASLLPLVDTGNGGKDANINSRIKLLEIEQQLSKGHDLYFKQQYQKAAGHYTVAQGLIYQMLKPSFPLDVVLQPGIKFPFDHTLMAPLLETSLKYVEAITPRTIETDFAAASIDIPTDLENPLSLYDDIGINVSDKVQRAVYDDSQLAASYAEQGQWEKAAYFYSSAQKSLGNPQTPEGIAAKAALNLNLGGVYVQMGSSEEAIPVLKQAFEAFQQAQDVEGQAQASINLAASYVQAGKKEEADQFIAQAKELLHQTDGSERLVTEPNNGGRPAAVTNEEAAISLHSAISEVRTMQPNVVLSSNNLLLDGARAVKKVSRPGSLKTSVLTEAVEKNGKAITFRLVGKGNGWMAQPVKSKVEIEAKKYRKELGVLVGDKVEKFGWEASLNIPAGEVISKVYDARVNFTDLVAVRWPYYVAPDFAVQLPHLYYYVLPVALADCSHALGEFEKAESLYLQAADYQYINQPVEVPALWQKIAKNTLEWGNALYRDDEYAPALKVYRKILEPPGAASVVDTGAPGYAHPKLKQTGDSVKAMLENYAADGPGALNPALAAIVLEIRARVLQLHAGLDFLGMQASLVPIWSFEYLQNISRYFAQQVIGAERDYINFWDRGENEALTRQQLAQTTVLAAAEQELAKQQREAAQVERQVYVAGQNLAATRGANAQANRTDYAAMSAERISLSTTMAWYSSQNPWELGNPIPGNGPDAGKQIHEVIAEKTARQQTITREYELGAMDRQIVELQQGEVMAQAQVDAATARVEAAQQLEVVAQLKTQYAKDNLNAFNNQLFTPEVWYQLGMFMRGICQSYLNMAIRVGRMMQRAYNFENDLNRNFIKTNYLINPGMGRLAGDALLLDINNFTYDEITTVQRKQMPVRQTLSLASRYPFQFQTQFKNTGRLEFETRTEDFDLAFPGTYAQRIESVEVEIEGILPVSGLKGTLANSGISWYRTPNPDEIKCRIQSKETLVLSEYRIKEDAIIFPSDQRLLKIFEGAGTASSWELEIPKATNDVDFNTITDVRLHFYYHTRYDTQLATHVKGLLATYAGINLRSRTYPLRWLFPDAFFHFQDTGQLTFSLNKLDFPFNETDPQIRSLAMLVVMKPGVDPAGIKLRLGVPSHPAPELASPNAQGEISVPAGHPWEALETGAAVGGYLVEIRKDENPGLVTDDQLQLDDLANIVLIVEYEFTPRT